MFGNGSAKLTEAMIEPLFFARKSGILLQLSKLYTASNTSATDSIMLQSAFLQVLHDLIAAVNGSESPLSTGLKALAEGVSEKERVRM